MIQLKQDNFQKINKSRTYMTITINNVFLQDKIAILEKYYFITIYEITTNSQHVEDLKLKYKPNS